MGDFEIRYSGAVAGRVREEIARAGGNEVCFVASVGGDGRLLDVRVVARGNSTAVLAAVRDCRAGQLLIHNHPSGNLTPSDADLTVADRLWAEGLGFAITDNDASELYVVVPPPEPRETKPLDLHLIETDLAPGGAVARAHPQYEDRPKQREFARLVAELYAKPGIGLAEAGTGIGKSAGYLVPAIHWAVLNRERTVVSTNTINLQEQLVRKDLPFLREALGIRFRFALVKGRNNYISIRRAKLAMLNAASLFPDNREMELRAIADWLETTTDGSRSDLPLRPSDEVWDEVASESDVCLRARCPHYDRCFYQRSRRDAATADILVVNHHLLFSDLAVRQAAGNFDAPAVLPHYKRLVLDEAHNIEETATRHMGASVTRRGFQRTLKRLENRGKGLLPTVESLLLRRKPDLLVKAALDLIQQRLRPELDGAWKRGSEVFRLLEEVARTAPDGILRIDDDFIRHPVWSAGLEEDLSATIVHLDTLARGLDSLRDKMKVDEELARAHEEHLVELRAAARRIGAVAFALRTALRPGPEEKHEQVRWIQSRPARSASGEEIDGSVQIAVAPIDMGPVLRETLFDRVPTVLLTSATLATGGGFAFVRERLGLADHPSVQEAVFPSPFDFPAQAMLVVPSDLPLPDAGREGRSGMSRRSVRRTVSEAGGGYDGAAPGDPSSGGGWAGGHAGATARIVREVVEITDGGVFVLFTSYRSLAALADSLRRSDFAGRWPLFVQGEGPRPRLLEEFVADGRGVLLGTDSFWEGVDVPGDPLRAIVIPKLPFKVPSEPVTAARSAAIEAAGGDAFHSYMLPHAAIRLKQGFGRLIRSRADRGAVVLLDGRIVQRRYGRYLLDSLPPARLIVGPWADCRTELARFFDRAEAPAVDTAARI